MQQEIIATYLSLMDKLETLPEAVAEAQSMLGLICDPVAARVEVPCLGKNIIAASNAFSCANVALAGYDQVIPFDEVVDAARRVALNTESSESKSSGISSSV